MLPPRSQIPDEETLEYLERYFVEGESTLHDPFVARAVTSHSMIVTRLRDVLIKLRVRTHPTTEESLARAMQARGLRSSWGAVVPKTSRIPMGPRTRVSRYLWPMLGVLVAVVVGVSLKDRVQNPMVKTIIAPRDIVYTSANGQRTNVTLPDGSTVLLNVASRLRVPVDFGEGHRTLTLQGEALFNVTHATGQPFTVMSGSASVRVLGTTFVVRHYHTDTMTTVAVREGKVAVQSVVVPAEWQANVRSSGAIDLHTADSAKFSFASGVLTFENVTLADAIPELSRWYDADIRLASPELATKRISATCPSSTVDALATILEYVLDVRVERIGRTLTLYPKGT